MKLDGKVAIVTGAGTGIGRAIALAMAKEGAHVVIADVDLPAAENVASEVKSTGGMAQAIKVDVTKRAEVGQLVEKILETSDRIDILVNNAGTGKIAPFEDLAEADWDSIINVNLKGVYLCSQAVGRQMIKQKRGKIINIASAGGHRGVPEQAAYNSSKGGVLQLTRTVAMEWAKYKINVNSVSPGVTRTQLVEKLIEEDPEFLQNRDRMIPLGRINTPEDLTSTVLFLASSESDFITGQDIVVDGGSLALHPSYMSWLQNQPR